MATPNGTTATEKRVLEWPANRPTDQLIAERMLAAALHNYHTTHTRPSSDHPFVTWDEMTDAQRAFYIDWAIPQAIQCVWKGR